MLPVSQNRECYSLAVRINCLLNFAFFRSLSVPPVLNAGFKIAVSLDSLLPSSVSSWDNKTLTPPTPYAQNLAWREGLCSSKFSALFSSPKILYECSWRAAAPASKAFRLSQHQQCLYFSLVTLCETGQE